MYSWLALAQMDAMVGDIAGNAARIREARAEAARLGAELLACPELAICGYPPEDLVLRPSFRAACREAVLALAAETADGGPALLVGSPWEENGVTYNAALLLDGGKIAHIHRKLHLPNYGVFDERRLFAPGPSPRVAQWRGRRLGLLVCEDVWYTDAASALSAQGAEMLLVINASPFESGKQAQRIEACAKAVREARRPLVYVNRVGAQDDIVFDGGAFALDANAQVTMQWPRFQRRTAVAANECAATLGDEEETWQALVLGLGDYVRKNRFPGVVLGISGGIDSAVAATLAADALGAEKLLGVLLPSALTSRESNEDALALAENLGIKTETVPIADAREAVHRALADSVPDAKRNALLVDGNIQARLRGLMLMAISNATGRMLISTSNKSEAAVGYTTLYGDACGGYAPLKDVYKTRIYALARWRNAQKHVIPERSITKAPTAELAPGQKDEDQLPPYPLLDAILERLIERRMDIREIAAEGYERETVERVASLLRTAEFKRRQMPPGAKVTSMLFGRDWRYPLTNGWKG